MTRMTVNEAVEYLKAIATETQIVIINDAVDVILNAKETGAPAQNMPRVEICANDPCEYCVAEKCRSCEHFDNFVGRKLSPVG